MDLLEQPGALGNCHSTTEMIFINQYPWSFKNFDLKGVDERNDMVIVENRYD